MTEPVDVRQPPSSIEKVALAIVAAALVGFAIYGVVSDAPSTVGYLTSVVVVGALILWLRRRPIPPFLAIALALDAIVHMAGGMVTLKGGDVLYDGSIGPFITSWDTHLLQYDHLVHAFGSFVATLALWVLVVPPGTTGTGRRNMIVLCLLASLGIGAANEAVEFVATLAHHGAHVGGYMNTGWDLMANALGAVMGAIVLAVAPTVLEPA
jgi:uncharacterized membrane protein YjdF